MTFELIVSLAIFALSTTLQPGPNNALLMAQGLNFGMWRTLPAILGLSLGFVAMMLSVGFGLAAVFNVFQALHTLLKLLSVIYLLYLAWRVANASPRIGEAGARPMSFSEGIGVICLNPQGWVFATSFVTAYLVRSDLIQSVMTLTAVCGLARFTGASAWALFGASLRQLLKSPRAVRTLNITMAVLMVASLTPIVTDLATELLASKKAGSSRGSPLEWVLGR